MVSAGCSDVVTEPLLLPTSGVTLPPGSNTADNARADVSARSIWNRLERAFLDVRVYHAGMGEEAKNPIQEGCSKDGQ